uniref:RRM domain-containing protein n=1 Tax=Chromera velia CCMP2878 TaxID=1169474 RepID=A0A0G4F918_9ALVE|eukprot:Cvel_15648.t1-p1 / transcript=Cvel_15648.t1 / gene=Cvel_15648 / organism=Chromera_velia_CCMP2878 / gene_product=Splicing factor U2AF-associated protein 2, putative / transcript_product=Splicing factor U2AF-associated protein 2, putative / location=Cvel_scaffold1167:38825-46645(-) / protein_length=705 / sequence_SO=supercontig / SO=protein_coding / is_pseudo=false
MASQESHAEAETAAAGGGDAAQAESQDVPMEMQQWFFHPEGGEGDQAVVGPVTFQHVMTLLKSGEIYAETPVWSPSLPGWLRLRESPLKDVYQKMHAEEDDEDEDMVGEAGGHGQANGVTAAAAASSSHVSNGTGGPHHAPSPAPEEEQTARMKRAEYEAVDEKLRYIDPMDGKPKMFNDTTMQWITVIFTDGPQPSEESAKSGGASAAAAASSSASSSSSAAGGGGGYTEAEMTFPGDGDATAPGGQTGGQQPTGPQAEVSQMTDEQREKAAKKKAYRERLKERKKAGEFVAARKNPNVYVSSLPADVTEEELERIFKKAGALKMDLNSGKSRVKIYRNDKNECQGDALITFQKEESVALALKYLHEYELRKDCKICVRQAEFKAPMGESSKGSSGLTAEEQKQKEAERRARRAEEQKRLAARRNIEQRSLAWDEGTLVDSADRRTAVIEGMFTVEEARTMGDGFYKRLKDVVKPAAAALGGGVVHSVTPIEGHPKGVVCVKFRQALCAEQLVSALKEREYRGQELSAYLHDGRTDLRALSVRTREAEGDPQAGKGDRGSDWGIPQLLDSSAVRQAAGGFRDDLGGLEGDDADEEEEPGEGRGVKRQMGSGGGILSKEGGTGVGGAGGRRVKVRSEQQQPGGEGGQIQQRHHAAAAAVAAPPATAAAAALAPETDGAEEDQNKEDFADWLEGGSSDEDLQVKTQ